MHAAILAIGDELTLGQNIDTNSPWIAARLAERSILTTEQRTVADDQPAIAAAICDLSRRFELLIVTGGLGPTDDDLTREALQAVLDPGASPVLDDGALAHIAKRFESRGVSMPAMNRKQAMRPASMRFLPNPNGTAPGLAGMIGRCQVFSLPGPPREMQTMFVDHVLPAIPPAQSDHVILTAMVHEHGMGESDAAQRLGDMMDRQRNPLVGITVSDSIVSARIRAVGTSAAANGQVLETAEHIERLWQPYVFGRDGQTLPEVVGKLLQEKGRTLVTAESCTGGWLGKAIVDVPGSSDYYRGGWVTYSNALKQSQLQVPPDLIDEHGAISRQVAAAMAVGALGTSDADESISITGIAGPIRDHAPSEKRVGTVFIAHSRRLSHDVSTVVRHFLFPGDRTTVRDRSVKAALQMLRFGLLEVPSDVALLWEVRQYSGADL